MIQAFSFHVRSPSASQSHVFNDFLNYFIFGSNPYNLYLSPNSSYSMPPAAALLLYSKNWRILPPAQLQYNDTG
jgi:hypothetical protein